MNGFDILLLAVVAAAVVLAIRAVGKGKSSGCGGDCAHCGECEEKKSL